MKVPVLVPGFCWLRKTLPSAAFSNVKMETNVSTPVAGSGDEAEAGADRANTATPATSAAMNDFLPLSPYPAREAIMPLGVNSARVL